MENQGRFQPEEQGQVWRGAWPPPHSEIYRHILWSYFQPLTILFSAFTPFVFHQLSSTIYINGTETNTRETVFTKLKQWEVPWTDPKAQSRTVSGPAPWTHFLVRSHQWAVQETLESETSTHGTGSPLTFLGLTMRDLWLMTPLLILIFLDGQHDIHK